MSSHLSLISRPFLLNFVWLESRLYRWKQTTLTSNDILIYLLKTRGDTALWDGQGWRWKKGCEQTGSSRVRDHMWMTLVGHSSTSLTLQHETKREGKFYVTTQKYKHERRAKWICYAGVRKTIKPNRRRRHHPMLFFTVIVVVCIESWAHFHFSQHVACRHFIAIIEFLKWTQKFSPDNEFLISLTSMNILYCCCLQLSLSMNFICANCNSLLFIPLLRVVFKQQWTERKQRNIIRAISSGC